MSVKNLILRISRSSNIGSILMRPLFKIRYFFKYDLISDKEFINKRFKKAFGRDINFEDPKTLNEKICYLKLKDRTELHTICSDKFAVRKYIEEKIGKEYLVPLYFETKSLKDLTKSVLPDEPCIIKTNHDSGGGVFVYDRESADMDEIKKSLGRRLYTNYYQRSKEWQYKNIEPRIIIEKLLQTAEGKIPKDFKVHCFNGSVRMISVDIDRFGDKHYRNWYTKDWQREPYKWSSPKADGTRTDPSPEDVEKPRTLDQMIRLSEILAKPFPYVRIDWYDVDGALYFGEITFHHNGGTQPILPEKYDLKLGEELNVETLTEY